MLLLVWMRYTIILTFSLFCICLLWLGDAGYCSTSWLAGDCSEYNRSGADGGSGSMDTWLFPAYFAQYRATTPLPFSVCNSSNHLQVCNFIPPLTVDCVWMSLLCLRMFVNTSEAELILPQWCFPKWSFWLCFQYSLIN